ncbi:hypothetical protein ABBQ38_010982 [Trebouxia sp. C0009 RCD-2024]
MLSRSNLMVLARTEGFDPTGATNGELRDFITQKTSEAGSSSYIAQRLSTNHVLWYLAAAKGATPLRSEGFTFSHSGLLYILGGEPVEAARHPHLLMCAHDRKWRAVQGFKDPVDATLGQFSGVVLKNNLYIVGSEKEQAVMRLLNLCTREWDTFPMPVCLSKAGHASLLAADHLILFGECPLYCAVQRNSPVLWPRMLHMSKVLYNPAGRGYCEGFGSNNIVWTRDMSSATWQRHTVIGNKPCAQLAKALTVVDDHAYVLVLKDESLHIHELDLQTWRWRRVSQGQMPFSMTAHDSIATTLLQDRWWVVHGGSVEVGLQGCCNQIHAFDFKSMCWCRSLVPPARLGHRTGHTAASHHDQIIIVGGKRGEEMLADVQRVWFEPATYDECMPPFKLRNCQSAGAQQSRLFPDATITVGREQFGVHRNVLSDHSLYFQRLFSSSMQEGRLSRVDIADMDAEVLSLAIDWMYGSVDEPLELHEAAHMMRAGDRLGILDLRDASARICCQWLEHLRSVCWLEHRQSVDVKEILRFATAIEASQVAWDMGRHVAGLEALLPHTGSGNRHIPVATHSQESADLETSNSLQLASKTITDPAEVSGSQHVSGQIPAMASINIDAKCGFCDGSNQGRCGPAWQHAKDMLHRDHPTPEEASRQYVTALALRATAKQEGGQCSISLIPSSRHRSLAFLLLVSSL